MTLRKFATLAVLDARMWNDTRRTAHRATFQYEPREGFIYVRSRAISSRTNDNFDHFPAEEIEQAYLSFVGKPVFVNHHNDNHRRARGVIIDAALHRDTLADGQPDTWVEVLMEVDAVRFPKLAAAILRGDVERTSMGCDVAFSVCSVCNNRASTPMEYCRHIPSMKGQKVRRVTASGTQEDVLVYEKCISEGSLVLTARGEVPIEQVLVGDLVLTRQGWRNVAGSAFMGIKETVVVTLDDGRQITCTPDHRIATEDGWVEAAALLPSSRCYTAALPAMTHLLPSANLDSGVLVGVGVSDRAVGLGGLPVVSPVVFGQDGFQMVSLDAEAYPADVVDLQAADVHATQAHDGSMHQVFAVGDPVHDAVAVALAGRTLPDAAGAKLGHSQLGEGSDEESFQLLGVRSVIHGATVPVYDLAVDGEHEFVANGIVVHNCYGLKFFENSLLVEDPADPTAIVVDVDARGVGGGYTGGVPSLHDDVLPRSASLDLADERRGDAEAGGNLGDRHLATASLAVRRQGQQVTLDDDDISLSELRRVIALTDEAAASGDHVGRVVGVGAQHPVAGVVAQGHVARVANHQIVRDRADELGVAPAVRTHRAAPRIAQAEPAVPAVDERAARPRMAGVRPPAGVDLRQVPLHVGLGAQEAAGGRVERHAGEDSPSSHTVARAHKFREQREASVRKHASASYTVVQSSDFGRHTFELHIAGCGDLSQPKYRDAGKATFEADSLDEAIEMAYEPELGYTRQDLKVFPCATSGVPSEPRAVDPDLCPGSGMPIERSNRRLQIPCPVCGKNVKAGDMRTGRMRQDIPKHKPLTATGARMARTATRRLAYGETVAPAQVSTLRDDSCPVCGEVNGFNGERCMTCGYFKPPDEFMDPDLTKAKEVDLRQDQEETAEIDATGDTDDVFDLGAPGDSQAAPAEGKPQAQGDAPVATPDDPNQDGDPNVVGEVSAPPATTPAEEGAQDAQRGQAPVDLKGHESPPPDAQPHKPVVDQQDPELKGNVFQLEKPAEGVQERSKPDAVVAPKPDAPKADAPKPEGDQPSADSKPAEGEPEDAKSEDEDEDDESEFPPKKKTPKQATRRNRGESNMRPTLKALAEQQIMLTANRQAIQAIATLAGVDVAPIYATADRRIASLQRRADAENPAQPIPEPGSEAPSQSSSDALGDLNDADVSTAGGVTEEDGLAGKTVDVTAVGEVMPEEAAGTADVTKPTSGIEVSENDSQTSGDVTSRTFDPENAFPIEPAFAAAQKRTFASLHLARLRLAAGIAQGDDLVVGESIAKSAMSDEAIDAEIGTLTRVRTASRALQSAPVRTDNRRAVPSLGATASSSAPIMGNADPGLDDALMFL